MYILLSLLVSTLGHALLLSQDRPLAETTNGTYEGTFLSALHQDQYMGIPYAQPPTGARRYSLPQSLQATWSDHRDAKLLPNACPQFSNTDDFASLGVKVDEDCLALNIVKPEGPVEGLPVVIWIHGGSYLTIVHESVALGKPMVAVSINYRLGYFGFLASNELLNTGNVNLGLRDQQLAFQWVHENIKAFGGDPSKVTLWGESAGAMSIGAHLVSQGGDNHGLYRAAILESGGATVDAYNGTDYYQPIYDSIVSKTNCNKAYDTLDCLRHVPYTELYSVLNETVHSIYRLDFMPIIDGSFIREWPHISMMEGRTANIPIITGSNTDEGTTFCPTTLNTTGELRSFLLNEAGFKLKNTTVDRLLELYPDTPGFGSPFNDNATTYPGYGTQYKRTAALVGDYVLIAANRLNAKTYTQHNRDVWAYRFNMQPIFTPPEIGVSHGIDLLFAFGIPNALLSASQNATSKFMVDSWVSFVHDLDPNHGNKAKHFPKWPKYNEKSMNIVLDEQLYLERDDYRQEGIQYINDHLLEFVS
ncbi:cholinesterase [Pyrenochaeta sp. DS3sAY3a]|nr:cholinesterase [Pyrenochaeta sp. DS3sAY3a]